jgi:hypothetical protein
MVFYGRRRRLAYLADTRPGGGSGRVAAPGVLADPLELPPADDGEVLHAVDLVDPHQPLRHQLIDHGTHCVVVDRVAGKHLHADGAGLERLHAVIIGEVPQADEQEAGHRLAVDDCLPGPEVGRNCTVAGHQSDSSSRNCRRCTAGIC